LLELAESNAGKKVQQLEASWEAELAARTAALEELQSILHLPTLPERIEGYDISHLAGTETVGSMVVMRNGKADNAHYRNFTIHSLAEGTIDDYASLKEVLYRRLQYVVHSTNKRVEQLAAQGYTLRKAKKADINTLQALYTADIPQVTDMYVVEQEGCIVSALRKHTHDGLTEIDRVYFAESLPRTVQEALVLFALKTTKKGKVYVCTSVDMQEFWSSVGAKVIRTVPKSMQTEGERLPFCMSILMSTKKPDVSLTAVPDLLVIDGGKGQLNTVKKVLDSLQLSVPVIGLAKREEEIFVPGKSLPIICRQDSQAKFLLMRLRNEAHRFANVHREKRGLKTALQTRG
jgi:excinuclease UvrABC nuclease subunit